MAIGLSQERTYDILSKLLFFNLRYHHHFRCRTSTVGHTSSPNVTTATGSVNHIIQTKLESSFRKATTKESGIPAHSPDETRISISKESLHHGLILENVSQMFVSLYACADGWHGWCVDAVKLACTRTCDVRTRQRGIRHRCSTSHLLIGVGN